MATIRRGDSLGKASVINAVVFDMDGVLCRYRIERRLALLASWSGQSPDAIHAAIWRSGFEDEAERGVVSADEYLRGFGERMGYPLGAAQGSRPGGRRSSQASSARALGKVPRSGVAHIICAGGSADAVRNE